MSNTNAEGVLTPLVFLKLLKKIEEEKKKIVESTNNYYSTTTLLHYYSNQRYREILDFIAENEAFTTRILELSLNLNRANFHHIIKRLEDQGVLLRVGVIRTKRDGRPANIYLISGGNQDRIVNARKIHMELVTRNNHPAIESFEYEAAIREVIERITEKNKYRSKKATHRLEIADLIREVHGTYKRAICEAVINHFKGAGWEVAI